MARGIMANDMWSTENELYEFVRDLYKLSPDELLLMCVWRLLSISSENVLWDFLWHLCLYGSYMMGPALNVLNRPPGVKPCHT